MITVRALDDNNINNISRENETWCDGDPMPLQFVQSELPWSLGRVIPVWNRRGHEDVPRRKKKRPGTIHQLDSLHQKSPMS